MSASAPACATGSSGAPASVEPRAIAEAPAQALEVATAGAEREPGLSCAALERSATVLHDDGERHKSQDSRVAALELYDLYLRRCPDEPEYAELLYYRAELLWAIAATRYETDEEAGKRDFARAHVAFNRVLARGPSRHTRDAAYAQMLAKLNELEWDDGPLRTASSLKVRAEHRFVRSPYTRAERELLASFDTFERHGEPTPRTRLQLRYRRARLAMQRFHLGEAEALALGLFDGSKPTAFQVWAAELVTDVRTIRWVDPAATPDERRAARRQLARWLYQLESLPCFGHDEADELRAAVTRLRQQLRHAGGALRSGAGALTVQAPRA